jgi:hypothetical protein
MTNGIDRTRVVTFCVFVLLALAGCGGDTGGGSVRATAEALGTRYPTATAHPLAGIGQVTSTSIVITNEVEATRIVTQAVAVEVTREVVVVVTATPDIAGADAQPAMDESAQPCPIKYWRGGRCTATQAQIDAAASESK